MKTQDISTALRGLIAIFTLSLCSTAWALLIPGSDALQGVGVGAGLRGEFWHTPSGATNAYDIAPTLAYVESHPTSDGTFTATIIGYGANDQWPIQTFLQGDAGSYVGPTVNFGDSIIRLRGFLDIESPGTIGFSSGHDDSLQLQVGSVILYSAGCCGVSEASATFSQAGKYPIELVYSDTYFPPPTGSGSFGLTVDTGTGYQTIPTSMLYQNLQVPEPDTLFLLGMALAVLSLGRRQQRIA